MASGSPPRGSPFGPQSNAQVTNPNAQQTPPVNPPPNANRTSLTNRQSLAGSAPGSNPAANPPTTASIRRSATGQPPASRRASAQPIGHPLDHPLAQSKDASPRDSRLSFGHWSVGPTGYRKLDEEQRRPGAPLERRSSILLPHLQQSEKRFFELVALNDVNDVRNFLAQSPGFNINCVNFQGLSALHVALQSRSEHMVEFLLSQPHIDIGDSILHAIRDNQIKILQLLLDKLQETAPGLEFVGATHSSDFPDHVTPLILAAQCGHFEIIELLIERGHKISKPHAPDCKCTECIMHLQHDDLLHGETLRLSLYRAITNPAYICHSTNDPILTAFLLSKELAECSSMVPEFRTAYKDLAQEISAFAVELIACCRSTEEMDLILSQKAGISSPNLIFPRLVLAMNYKQKAFVSHPNTQQVVEAVWRGDWYEWKYKHIIVRTLYPLSRLFLIPLIAILSVFVPKHSWLKHWGIPLNKMITHNASYLVFLLLLFLESNMDKSGQKRGPPDSGMEPFIILYVAGFIWSSFRMCMIKGPRFYFSALWNIFDMIMYILFILTFVFWFAAYVDVKANDQADLERKYWHHLDPTLISEGSFAVAVIMAFFRLMLLCRLDYYLGPLQISLGKMSADIFKYLTVFAIIMVAFSSGMARYYHYYSGMVQVDENGIKTAQVDSFIDFGTSLKTFFWAIFCLSPLEAGDVIIENLPGEKEKTTIINTHKFTECVGYIVYGIFEILTVVILLNMLVATMSTTFQRVCDNVDVEWTFGKTDIYIEFMNQTILPSPLNLLPTAKGIAAVIEWIRMASSGKGNKAARCTLNHCCFVEVEADEHLQKDFPVLMSQIVQRYFREKDSNAVASNDIDMLRNDVAELKDLYRNLLPQG